MCEIDFGGQKQTLCRNCYTNLFARRYKDLLPQKVLKSCVKQQFKVAETFTSDSDVIGSVFEMYKGPYKAMHHGYLLFHQNNLEECHKILNEGLQSSQDFIPGWLVLCKCLIKMHKGTNAEKAAK